MALSVNWGSFCRELRGSFKGFGVDIKQVWSWYDHRDYVAVSSVNLDPFLWVSCKKSLTTWGPY